jgi:hypothetical protein
MKNIKILKIWWKKGNNSKMGNGIYFKIAGCVDLAVLIIFSHVRFLILLTFFELLPITCNFTICFIFSNSGYVGWCTASPDTILKLDTLVMILTKFGFHWSSTFRGEDFWKSLRRTTCDGNSSHDPSGQVS